MNLQKIVIAATIFSSLFIFSDFARSDDQSLFDKLGATVGASYGIGSMQNSGMGLNSRTMSAFSFEGLGGYKINHFLVGIDFDYRIQSQLTDLSSAGGTNLKGNSWILGVGAKYTFNPRWALQASLGFVGKYEFGKQTSALLDDHLSSPIALRIKPQYFPVLGLPLSIDLDFRYITWGNFDVAGVDSSQSTSEFSAGAGITYHFGGKREPAVSTEVAAVAQVNNQNPIEAPVRVQNKTEDQQKSLAELLDVKKTDQGLMVNLGSDSFEPNSALLGAHAKETIAKAGSILSHDPNQKIRVEGYSDTSGPKAKNIELSKKRAANVRELLIENGVKAENISAQGFGPEKPIADNKTPEGRQQNRRVEIYIDQPGN